jgi:hypothetical protein
MTNYLVFWCGEFSDCNARQFVFWKGVGGGMYIVYNYTFLKRMGKRGEFWEGGN